MEWDPLEVVLTQWLDMIDTGKVVAKVTSSRGFWECEPWDIMPYSEHDLTHAVTSFNNLITRIECLVEDQSLKTLDNLDDQLRLLEACKAKLDQPVSEEQLGLLPREVLDSAGIPEGFIRQFLLQVRRPKTVRYIAPGLRLPISSDFAPYPFQDFSMPRINQCDYPVFPMPLFITDIKSPTQLLPWPYHEVMNLSYGLWIEAWTKTGCILTKTPVVSIYHFSSVQIDLPALPMIRY